MNMTDIIVTSLADFFEANNVNFRCLGKEVNVENPKTTVELIPANELACQYTDCKVTICGDIENDINAILHHMHLVVDAKQFCEIKFDIWRKRDRFINGNEILNIEIPSHGIFCDDKYVHYRKPIQIRFVDYEGKRYSVDPEDMNRAGYTVLAFKLENVHHFNGIVHCVGSHVNIDNGILCTSHNNIGKPLSIDIIHDVATKLSIMNLDSCYDKLFHLKMLKPFLKIGEQI